MCCLRKVGEEQAFFLARHVVQCIMWNLKMVREYKRMYSMYKCVFVLLVMQISVHNLMVGRYQMLVPTWTSICAEPALGNNITIINKYS